MKYTQTGRTMIEMLGVLAIIAVLSVGGIAGFSQALTKWKINRTVQQITHLVTRLRIAFIAQKDYHGLGSSEEEVNFVLLRAKIVPEASLARDSEGRIMVPFKIRNLFKGNITAHYTDKIIEGDHAAFVIRYDYIPKSACMEIATSAWGGPNGSGFVASSINMPIPETPLYAECEPTDPRQRGFALHCTQTGVMPNEVAARACSRKKDNYLEFMFY